jgi:hypothetical protein
VTTEVYITKGLRVRYEFFRAYPTCLAGAQMKLGATMVSGTGVVTDVRGDHPTAPTRIWFMVRPDGGEDEVEVPQGGVKEVLV